MSESVGEVFAIFEVEACGFPVSKSVIKIGWLGFVSGEFA